MLEVEPEPGEEEEVEEAPQEVVKLAARLIEKAQRFHSRKTRDNCV